MDNIHAFGQALVEAIIARGISNVEYLADDEAIRFDNDNDHGILNVENFHKMTLAGRPLDDIAEQIVRLHQTMEQMKNAPPLDFETVKPLLRMTIVSDDFKADMGTFRAILPGVKAALVLDYPEFMRHVIPRDIEAMGQAEDLLWYAATANTLADAPEPTPVDLGEAGEALVFECDYGAAHAWMFAASQDGALLAMPRRDLGFVMLANRGDMQAATSAARIALGFFDAPDGDHSLVATVYYLEKGSLAGIIQAAPMPRQAS